MHKEKYLKWVEETGIGHIKNIDAPEINSILEKPSREFDNSTPETLRHYMVVMQRYRLFLIREIGILRSKIDILNRRIEVQVSATASKYQAASQSERKALAYQSDPKIVDWLEELEDCQTKYSQIVGLPEGLQGFIDKIDRIEYRKCFKDRTEDLHND